MTVGIVDPLEMVQVENADGKRMDTTVAQGFLVFEDLVHLAAVEHLGGVVDDGNALDGVYGKDNFSKRSIFSRSDFLMRCGYFRF